MWLLVIASMDGSPWKIVSVAIYAFTLLVLYSASTVYHSVRGRKKAIMQKVDHFSIYLLIAGSYTPFCLVTLRGPWGWTLFGIVWGLALIGILQEIKPRSEARILSIVIYAVMGWIVLVAVKPLLAALGSRFCLAGVGRRAVHRGHYLFCAGSSFAPCPRDLASVRDRREFAALRGDFVLCPLRLLRDQAIQLRLRPSAEHLQQVAQGMGRRFVGAGHRVQGDR